MSCINQNLSVMGVASCRSTFLCLMLSVRLVPFRISIHDLIPFSALCTSWVFDPRSGPAQPSPARSGPALRAPGAHTPPMRPLLSLSLIWISRATTSPLPLPPLSPRGALGIGDGDHRILDPEVSSPPLLLSLSLSLLFFLPHARPPFPLLARAPALPRSPAARTAPPLPCARRRPPPLPGPARRRSPAPCPAPRGGARFPLPAAAAPSPDPRRHPAPLPAAAIPPAPCSPGVAPGAAFGPRRGPCPGAASTPCVRRPGPRRGLAIPVCR
jgi:hypothetical protein